MTCVTVPSRDAYSSSVVGKTFNVAAAATHAKCNSKLKAAWIFHLWTTDIVIKPEKGFPYAYIYLTPMQGKFIKKSLKEYTRRVPVCISKRDLSAEFKW